LEKFIHEKKKLSVPLVLKHFFNVFLKQKSQSKVTMNKENDYQNFLQIDHQERTFGFLILAKTLNKNGQKSSFNNVMIHSTNIKQSLEEDCNEMQKIL
jgi:hypothetical protein